MSCSKERKGMDRRKFIKLLLGVAVGGQAFSYGASSRAKLPVKALGFSSLQEQPAMTYRLLGRTQFKSSRLDLGEVLHWPVEEEYACWIGLLRRG